jgi:hypothetical protein
VLLVRLAPPLRTKHGEKTPLLVRRVVAYPPQLLLLEGEFDVTANPCFVVLLAGTSLILQLLLRLERLDER